MFQGGHTTEAFALLSALDFARYTRRKYIISEGDQFSERRARQFEQERARSLPVSYSFEFGACIMTEYQQKDAQQFSILVIPRARRVHQPLLTTPPTALRSLLATIYHLSVIPLRSGVSTPFADVLLLNGPGTCCTLCVAVFVSRVRAMDTSNELSEAIA